MMTPKATYPAFGHDAGPNVNVPQTYFRLSPSAASSFKGTRDRASNMR